jgi:hypothetical protein
MGSISRTNGQSGAFLPTVIRKVFACSAGSCRCKMLQREDCKSRQLWLSSSPSTRGPRIGSF